MRLCLRDKKMKKTPKGTKAKVGNRKWRGSVGEMWETEGAGAEQNELKKQE